MRLSRWRWVVFVAATIVVLLMLLVTYVVVIDPDWRPQRSRGKGAWFLLLLFLLPIVARAVVIWTLGSLTAFGLATRALRLGDGQPDYWISVDGIANIGLLYARLVRWKYIERIEFRYDRFNTMAVIKRAPATRVDIVERIKGASALHLFNKSLIVIPLELVGLTKDEFVAVIRRFQPNLPFSDPKAAQP